MKIVTAKKLLAANDRLADENRALFDEHGVLAVNIMGSPGAGKTALIEALIPRLRDRLGLVVIDGDLATCKDAERVEALGARAIQINTDGGCHLDANMVATALQGLPWRELDLLLIENVGNLVCPASFDLGEHARIAVLSVTEGDDKVAKYPPLFKTVDLIAVNKIDLLPHVDFRIDRVTADARRLNPHAKILALSAKTGDGIGMCVEWILKKARRQRPPQAPAEHAARKARAQD